MICENCGAEFEENVLACPFCGADNFVMSKQEHEQTVSKIREEEQRIKALPKKVANKSTKLLILLAVAFIGIGMIISLIAYGIGKIQVKEKYQSDAALAVELEEFYQSGDYGAIYERTRNIYSTNRSLGKYTAVGTLYHTYQFGTENFESDLAYAKSLEKPEAFRSVTYFLEVLFLCDNLEENRFVYDEDVAVYYYRDAAMAFLKDHMCLTDEEINSFYERYASSEKKYEEDNGYTYQMREDEQNAINLDSGTLIYERLVGTK